MLILTRKKDEQIVIGSGKDAVVVTVVEIIGGSKVRIGIEAPRDVSVHRREIYDIINGDDDPNKEDGDDV